jgi:predicted Zn-dependent peptidase
MAGQPYMITGFTSPDEYSEKYSNFKRFLQEASMVPADKGKEFLESIVADVNQDEMREILKKYEDNGYLTSDERKQILFKLGKHQMGVKDKQNDINKQYQSVEKEY